MSQSVPTGTTALSFTFSTQTLRCVMRDGEPWFVAANVCEALDIKDTSMACSRLDDDERDTSTVGTPSGDQQMLIINESGLYSLILTSRKPEAKKFKKWVTSEVLPAIRKTGAYVASNAPQATTPPPASTAEYLSASDLQNIKRMIWFCTRAFNLDKTWVQAIWFYLRQILAVPSPHQFNVEHLPTVMFELHRATAISCQVRDLIIDIERQAAQRIFRKGECADVVLADLKRTAELGMLALKDDIAKLPSCFQNDVQRIGQRTPHQSDVDYGATEQPGYFDNTRGGAA